MNLIEFKDDNLAMLRAALVCAATQDVRYYLNGIHITPDRIEGTDGHRVACFKTPWGAADLDIIIPKFKIPAPVQKVLIAVQGEAVEIHMMDRGGAETITKLTAIDGNFPDVERILPAKDAQGTNSVVQVDPRMIVDVLNACRAPKHVGVDIHITGGKGDVYRVGLRGLPGLTFCIMPNIQIQGDRS